MTKKNFNEAVELKDLESLLDNTKKACSRIIYSKGYRLPSHIDLEDITQDAIIKLLKALETFDEKKSTANTFCDRVITNLISDHIRRFITEYKYFDPTATTADCIMGGRDENTDLYGDTKIVDKGDVAGNDDYYMVDILLDTTKLLTERQKRVFVLRQRGYTREEIARSLGVSVRTVAGEWSVVSKVLLDLIYVKES